MLFSFTFSGMLPPYERCIILWVFLNFCRSTILAVNFGVCAVFLRILLLWIKGGARSISLTQLTYNFFYDFGSVSVFDTTTLYSFCRFLPRL